MNLNRELSNENGGEAQKTFKQMQLSSKIITLIKKTKQQNVAEKSGYQTKCNNKEK